MVSWSAFAAAAPELAADGRGLFERSSPGDGLLATVRGDFPPRINPISMAILDGRLLAYLIVGSAKLGDLEADGRYALHANHDLAVPHEFQVRGHAHPVTDPQIQAAAAAAWTFEVDDTYRLYEFSIEQAVFGRRAGADDWPPVYTSWRNPKPGA